MNSVPPPQSLGPDLSPLAAEPDIREVGQDIAGLPVPSRSKIISWAFWDWGSAAFNAVATTFVFAVYLTSEGNFTTSFQANQYLSWGLTAAGLVIALLAPITGQRADRSGNGVKILGWFTLLVVVCMVLMFFVYPASPLGPIGALWMGIALLGLGNIFFEFASVSYNAMLNDLSTPQNRGVISGLGWGAGYLGGILLLLIVYFGLINPDVGLFGVTSENGMDVRVSMLCAAVWFGVFALPVLFNSPGKRTGARGRGKESLLDSYRLLFTTISMLWREARSTLRFLIASAVFRDGLAGVFIFGGIIAGSVFGFTPGQVIIFAIAANVVAGVATIVFGALNDRWGSKRIIMVSLVLMVIAGLMIFFFYRSGPIIFWIFGLGLTVFVGPIQSASRTFLANLIPEGREGEIFGLYATTGRVVSFLGPMMYGAGIFVGKRIVGGEPTQWGILGLMVVLILGLILMIPVKPEGEQAGTF